MINRIEVVKKYLDKEYFSGRIYEKQDFFRFQLAKIFLSRISIADEYVETIKRLSEEGLVVYALRQKSKLNSLILYELAGRKGLPQPLYCHGMNMSFWHPICRMIKLLWSSFLRLFSGEKKAWKKKLSYLERIIRRKNSVIIHLGQSEFINSRTAETGISSLINAQKSVDFPIFIVPILVSYGRRREKEDESLINILFGQTEHTGAIRRLITFMRYASKAFVITSESINLLNYLNVCSDNTPKKTIVRDLRAELIERIEKEKTAVVGPVLKSREAFIGMVLSDKNMQQFIADYTLKEKKEIAAVEKEAKKYLYEITADYSETMIQIWLKLLRWLWMNIFDGLVVDQEGLAKLRNISKKMPFIVIPCHRSHIDYLIFSYVLYVNNIQLTFIAAGNNLSFFPMGYIFRKSGAFFMRRSFRGNELYSEVFAKYMAILLKEGYAIEFFIEGGRSRSGKMVMPKYGLLSMVIQALQDKYCDNFAAIPVYLGYDRVIEERSYLKEISGEPKTPENTAEIIKTGSILRKRYGRVYLNIGEPIIMKDYLAAQEKHIEQMTLDERQGLYRKIGYEIVLEINKVSLVTPFSLVAAVILSHDRRGISHDDLSDVFNEFYEYLVMRKVKLAATFAQKDKAIIDAVNVFIQDGIISKVETEEDQLEDMLDVVYSLADENRLYLEYYKNNVLHFFVALSFVATSMMKSNEDIMSLGKIMADYKFLKKLLWNEFIFDEKTDDVDEVNNVLEYLFQRKMIKAEEREDGAWIEIKGRGRMKLKFFAGLIHNYLESYWIVIRSCYYLKKSIIEEKEWHKKIRSLGNRLYRKGEVLRMESLSHVNYINAIRFLEDAEIISAIVKEEKAQKREVLYSLTGNRAEMEVLRRRIFKLL
ncbi:MAG TPA: hypothetical protein ENN23_09450 [Deltaproteobacteria bacterium]|nr:hypothetical protein [Deltaproteobacteria bacterium]